MEEQTPAPIIIKRKKVVAGDGHHGGAWKVAYADFVTAMMAFFLLMWLLNATTEKQRKGLADYFSPTVPMARVSGGGDGAFYGDSVFTEETLARSGQGASVEFPTPNRTSSGNTPDSSEPTARLGPGAAVEEAEQLLETLQMRGGESMAALERMRHVVTRLTEEGLVIDIHEAEDARLFDPMTGDPTPLLRGTLTLVADVMKLVENSVSVAAHLSARPIVIRENPVWANSTGRAQAARELLEVSGLPRARFEKVAGFADRRPIDGDPMALRNSRVEVTLLRDGL